MRSMAAVAVESEASSEAGIFAGVVEVAGETPVVVVKALGFGGCEKDAAMAAARGKMMASRA